MQHIFFKCISVLCAISFITYIFIELIKSKKNSFYIEPEPESKSESKSDPEPKSDPVLMPVPVSVHYQEEQEKKRESMQREISCIEQSENRSYLENVFLPSPVFQSELSQYCNKKEYDYGYQFTDMYRHFSINMSTKLDQYRKIQRNVHKKMEKEKDKFSDKSTTPQISYVGQEGMKNPFDEIGRGINQLGDKIKKDVGKAMDPLKEVVDFINKIKKAFESIPERVNKLNRAFKSLGHGIEKEFESVGKSIHIGVTDVFSLIGAAGECGKKFMMNFNSCILWYLLNLMGEIIYGIFVEIPVFMLRFFFGVDVTEYIRDFFQVLTDIDTMFIEQTSFSFLHFPESIIHKCYSCDISGQINKLQVDFTKTIPDIMNEPNKIFKKAKSEFNDVFN